MTTRELLTKGRVFLRDASSSGALDAEILLAHVLKRSREELLIHDFVNVSRRCAARYEDLLQERYRGVPLPYLTGTKEFYGRSFIVTRSVLVPRPETEALVEYSLRVVHDHMHEKPSIIDIGTGSGVIAVTLAAEIPSALLLAIDSTRAALTVARRNARKHRVLRRMMFLQGDLLRNLNEHNQPTIIVANLPYVEAPSLANADRHRDTRGLLFEPQNALHGGPDGLYVIRRFFHQLSVSHLRESLHDIIVEHGRGQRRAILQIAHDAIPRFQPVSVTPFVTAWSQS